MEKERENMEYVDKLLQETEFLQLLEKLEQLEQNREFCRHGLTHLLDTARIAWIRALEQSQEWQKPTVQDKGKFDIPNKEMVYLAALLHDLGRIREYEEGTPHHEAGAVLAAELLEQITYPKERAARIVQAVAGHRSSPPEGDGTENLGELLAWADKKSRSCFHCKAREACKWEQEKRNDTVQY